MTCYIRVVPKYAPEFWRWQPNLCLTDLSEIGASNDTICMWINISNLYPNTPPNFEGGNQIHVCRIYLKSGASKDTICIWLNIFKLYPNTPPNFMFNGFIWNRGHLKIRFVYDLIYPNTSSKFMFNGFIWNQGRLKIRFVYDLIYPSCTQIRPWILTVATNFMFNGFIWNRGI